MRLLIVTCCFALLLSCSKREGEKDTLFELIDPGKSGVDFVNKVENTENFNFLEYLYFYNGGGVALGDINNDGLADIFFTANQGTNKLYLNEGNFSFKDISKSAQVEGSGSWSTGVTMADVNGDGLLDIYVCNVDKYKGLKGRNELFINNGDLTFSEKAEEYGLDFSGFATQAAFFDYDNDADLDVYLLNHSVHSVGSYGDATLRYQFDSLSGDRLMQSQLTQGEKKFVDVSQSAGIYRSKIGYGLGVAVADINRDGWQDILVGNDFHENDYLYFNNGDGTFSEALENSFGHSSRYSMGNDIGDINNDGLLDIISTDMLPKNPSILLKSGAEDKLEVNDIKLSLGYGHQLARNTLQLNRGNGHFSDIALYAKMFATDWSWSPLIADFDNDGYKDIHITNGIYKRPNDMDYIQYISNLEDFRFNPDNQKNIDDEMLKRMPTLQIANEAFKYSGNMEWTSTGKDWGLDQASYSNGSAYADLDNDGDLDLVINNVNQPAFIYRNKSNERLNNYIKISLKAQGANSMGLGTSIDIRAQGKVITNYLTTTRGFQSSVEPVLTIGLGRITQIDSLEIFWPTGKFQRLVNVDVNQHLMLQESDEDEMKPKVSLNPLFRVVPDLFEFKHNENLSYKDNDIEYLIPYRLSTLGPAMSAGDINFDGIMAVYVGGAAGQSGSLFVQNSKGEFKKTMQPSFEQDRYYEDVKSTFIDVDNDNDLDLIVLSGGNQYEDGHPMLVDRLYINTGGRFERSQGLREKGFNSSCIAVADIDLDGDRDLFIGSNSIKGHYGKSNGGILLINDGVGNFSNKTSELVPSLSDIGMINSALWLDFDKDNDFDLVVAGHWMPITFFVNEEGLFKDTVSIENSKGFWNEIKVADVDNDGDFDLIGANMGLNNKFTADKSHPLKLYVSDFDDNGTSDAVIMHYQEGRYIPMFTKDEIEKQTVAIKKKYTTYKEYAETVNGIGDLFNESKINQCLKREVTELRSMCFTNQGQGKFLSFPLPAEMQFSSINSIIVDDLNKDYIYDIITSGNNYYMHVNLGKLDADYGSIAYGMGNGKFNYINDKVSGLNIKGQVNASLKMVVDNKNYFLFALNNDSIRFYSNNAYEK